MATPKKPSILAPFFFSGGDPSERRYLSRLKKERKVQSIGPRLYTSLPAPQVKDEVRGNWSTIVSTLFPNALLSHRSALEYRPTQDGAIFLTGNTNRIVEYPGLKLHFIRGPSAQSDDVSFLQMKASSFSRALLENLSSPKSSRSVSTQEIEARLEQVLVQQGEAGLNLIRDQARKTAIALGWLTEMKRLEKIIRALSGSGNARDVEGGSAKARALGLPYDRPCFERLELLFRELVNFPLPKRIEPSGSPEHFLNKAFFESYFSNFIEGTTFDIAEAESIVFEKIIPKRRPQDAHDILGTFQIVSDTDEMNRVADDFATFERLLRQRHRTLMGKRPAVLPGKYKEKVNRAGNSVFVHPDHVRGTLHKGFEFLQSLPRGFARAIYVMFLVADVHPFTDGNGRMARIAMNAELISAGQASIIIPTVFRDDYLLALRALTRRHRPRPLIDMLIRAQRFSTLDFSSYPTILKHLEAHRWFFEPEDGKMIG